MLTSLLMILLGSPAAGDEGVAFRLVEMSGMAYSGPVTVGVPFRRGRLRDDASLSVVSGRVRSRVQHRVLCRHPDGSVRYAALTFPVRLSRGATRSYRVRIDHRSREMTSLVTVRIVEGAAEIETDRISLAIPKDVAVAFRGLSAQKAGARITGTVEGVSRAGELNVVDAGRYRVVVHQRGFLAVPSGSDYRVDRWITVRAGVQHIDVETLMTSVGGRGRAAPIDMEVSFDRKATVLVHGDGRQRLSHREMAFSLESASRGRWTFTGASSSIPLEHGDRGLGVLWAGGSLRLCRRDANMMTPSRLSYRPGRLGITLVSGDYHWWPGVRAGAAVRVTVTGRKSRSRPLRPFRDPVAIVEASERPEIGGRFPGTPVPGIAARSLRLRIARALEAEPRRRHGIEWPGEENAGDWRWSRADAGNLEYDTTWGYEAMGHIEGRADWIEMATLAARHLVNRDVDRAGSGLPLRHGRHHRTGGVEAGHVWVDGLLAVAHRTADPILLDDLEGIRDAWCRHVKSGEPRHWLTRSLAWGTMTGTAFLAHDNRPADREAVNILIRAIRAVRADGWSFSKPMKNGLRLANPWVDALLDEAVDRIPARMRKVLPSGASTRKRLEEACLQSPMRPVTMLTRDAAGVLGRRGGGANGEESLFFALGIVRRSERDGVAAPPAVVDIVTGAADRLAIDDKHFRGKELGQLMWIWPRLFGRRR